MEIEELNKYECLLQKHDIPFVSIGKYNKLKTQLFYLKFKSFFFKVSDKISILELELRGEIETINKISNDVHNTFLDDPIYKSIDPLKHGGSLLKHKYGYVKLNEVLKEKLNI